MANLRDVASSRCTWVPRRLPFPRKTQRAIPHLGERVKVDRSVRSCARSHLRVIPPTDLPYGRPCPCGLRAYCQTGSSFSSGGKRFAYSSASFHVSAQLKSRKYLRRAATCFLYASRLPYFFSFAGKK